MKIQKTKIVAEITGEQAIIYFRLSSVREMGEVQKIMNEIDLIAYNYKISVLIINFAKLRMLTSAFLSKLVTLNRSLTQAGIKLRLCCMSAEVQEPFKICKLQKLIPLYESEEKALEG